MPTRIALYLVVQRVSERASRKPVPEIMSCCDGVARNNRGDGAVRKEKASRVSVPDLPTTNAALLWDI